MSGNSLTVSIRVWEGDDPVTYQILKRLRPSERRALLRLALPFAFSNSLAALTEAAGERMAVAGVASPAPVPQPGDKAKRSAVSRRLIESLE